MPREELTDKDRALLSLLKENARQSTTALANRLGLSRTTVQNRLKRLEDIGIIQGYGVRLKRGAGVRDIRCHVLITHAPRMVDRIVTSLAKMRAVEAVHSVSGSVDLIVEIVTPTVDDMDRTIDQIGKIDGVEKTNSHLILSTRLDRGAQ